MSEVGSILDAFLTKTSDAISGVTTKRGDVEWEKIPSYPFAMIYDPALEKDHLEHRQEEKTGVAVLEIVGRGTLATPMTDEITLTWLDDLETELTGDRTLGGLVRWAWISSMAVTPPVKGDRQALILAVSWDLVV